ncbi:MAG TPA: hypothetical protein VIJ92_02855 [Ginsengibacter sp.]
MTRLNIIFLFLIALASCKKSEPAGVMIRIENNTNFTIDSVKLLYDTTNYNYGTILSNQTTAYVYFKSMPEIPAAMADSANKRILAGQLVPPDAYYNANLANGKYTLQIFPDSTLFYLYGAKFIKN